MNVIYLVALFCSKASELHDCFHLIIQLLHEEEYKLLEPQIILQWIKATKEKIEKGPEEVKGKEEQKGDA